MKYKSLFLTLLFLSAATLHAADSAARRELQQRSQEAALGVPQVRLLYPKAASGQQAVLDKLRSRFAEGHEAVRLAGATKTENDGTYTVQHGPGWTLQVSGDGTNVRYRNTEAIDGKDKKRVPVAERPTLEALEPKGRRFIAEQLRDLVRLGEGEELVPLFTRYQIEFSSSTAADAQPEPDMVAAAYLIFGRTVNGVHVIGRGSKVAVYFAVDGTVTGFDYDWPDYRVSDKVQKVAIPSEIRNRAKQLELPDLDAQGVTIEKIECGYFDGGFRHRNTAIPLQAACAVYAVRSTPLTGDGPDAGRTTYARVSFIPMGTSVDPDPNWPQAQRFLGRTVRMAGPPRELKKP